MSDGLVWYDSNWLNKYVAAKELIAEIAPARLQHFVNRLAVLRTDPDFAVKDVDKPFAPDVLCEIKEIIKSLPSDALEVHEAKRFGRFIVHNHPRFTELQVKLVNTVSELVGEPVEPSYNFLSLYTRMGVCEPHLDAPSAKWTLDVCVDQSEAWPIHFSKVVPWPEDRPKFEQNWQESIKNDPNLLFQSKTLTPGNGIVFSGSSQWHYRDPLSPTKNSESFCNLLFFHYIPRGAGDIVVPRNWSKVFGIPELANIPGINETY